MGGSRLALQGNLSALTLSSRDFKIEDGRAVIPLGTTVQGDVLIVIYHARSTLGGRLQAKVSSWAGRLAGPPWLSACSLLSPPPVQTPGFPTTGRPSAWGSGGTHPDPERPLVGEPPPHGRVPEAPRAWRLLLGVSGALGVTPFALSADGLHEDVPGPVPHGICASERSHCEVCQV